MTIFQEVIQIIMQNAFQKVFCINNNSCIFITRAYAKVSVIQIRAVDEHDSVRRSKKKKVGCWADMRVFSNVN